MGIASFTSFGFWRSASLIAQCRPTLCVPCAVDTSLVPRQLFPPGSKVYMLRGPPISMPELYGVRTLNTSGLHRKRLFSMPSQDPRHKIFLIPSDSLFFLRVLAEEPGDIIPGWYMGSAAVVKLRQADFPSYAGRRLQRPNRCGSFPSLRPHPQNRKPDTRQPSYCCRFVARPFRTNIRWVLMTNR